MSDATPIRVGRDASGRFVKLPPVEHDPEAEVWAAAEVHAPMHRFVQEPPVWRVRHVVMLPIAFVVVAGAVMAGMWWFR